MTIALAQDLKQRGIQRMPQEYRCPLGLLVKKIGYSSGSRRLALTAHGDDVERATDGVTADGRGDRELNGPPAPVPRLPHWLLNPFFL